MKVCTSGLEMYTNGFPQGTTNKVKQRAAELYNSLQATTAELQKHLSCIPPEYKYLWLRPSLTAQFWCKGVCDTIVIRGDLKKPDTLSIGLGDMENNVRIPLFKYTMEKMVTLGDLNAVLNVVHNKVFVGDSLIMFSKFTDHAAFEVETNSHRSKGNGMYVSNVPLQNKKAYSDTQLAHMEKLKEDNDFPFADMNTLRTVIVDLCKLQRGPLGSLVSHKLKYVVYVLVNESKQKEGVKRLFYFKSNNNDGTKFCTDKEGYAFLVKSGAINDKYDGGFF